MDEAIAVIDIGMTNKKVALYDRSLRMVDSVARTFDPIIDEGLETHDLAGMEAWFLDTLADFGKRREIGAIAVTTHGATMVCVGADGEPCAPCVYYTYEPSGDFQERFYRMAGERRELQASTGTPPLSAMINPAKGVFFLQERFPSAFARTRLLLNYPQYWAYRLTGKSGAEGTYTGCHSYFWDWKAARYSGVAEKLGVAALMPFPLRDSWDMLGKLEARARAALRPLERSHRDDGHSRLERLAAPPPRQAEGPRLHPQLYRYVVRPHASASELRLLRRRARQDRLLQSIRL